MNIDAPEYIISDRYNEDWTCLCGNDILGDGFVPSNPDGTDCDATPYTDLPGPLPPWDSKSMRCEKCGRVMNQNSIEVDPHRFHDRRPYRVRVTKGATQ